MLKLVINNQSYLIEKKILKKFSSTVTNAVNDSNDDSNDDINEINLPNIDATNDDILKFCLYLKFVKTFTLCNKKHIIGEPRSQIVEFFDINIAIDDTVMDIINSIGINELSLGFELLKMIKSCPNKTDLYHKLRSHIQFPQPKESDILYALRQIKIVAYVCDSNRYFKTCISSINYDNIRQHDINKSLAIKINIRETLAIEICTILAPILLPSYNGKQNSYIHKQIGMGHRWIDIPTVRDHLIAEIKRVFNLLEKAGYIINKKLRTWHIYEYISNSIRVQSYENYRIDKTRFKKTLCFKDGIMYDDSVKDFRIAYPWDYIIDTLSVNHADCINKGNDIFKPFITQILGADNYDRFIRDISEIFKGNTDTIIFRKTIPLCGETTLRLIILDLFDNVSAHVNPSIFRDRQITGDYLSSKRVACIDMVDDYYSDTKSIRNNTRNIFEWHLLLTKIVFVDDGILNNITDIIHDHDRRNINKIKYYNLSSDLTKIVNPVPNMDYNSPEMKEIISQEFGYSIIEYLKNNK